MLMLTFQASSKVCCAGDFDEGMHSVLLCVCEFYGRWGGYGDLLNSIHCCELYAFRAQTALYGNSHKILASQHQRQTAK